MHVFYFNCVRPSINKWIKSKIKNQKSKIKNQKSKIKNQKSKIKSLLSSPLLLLLLSSPLLSSPLLSSLLSSPPPPPPPPPPPLLSCNVFNSGIMFILDMFLDLRLARNLVLYLCKNCTIT